MRIYYNEMLGLSVLHSHQKSVNLNKILIPGIEPMDLVFVPIEVNNSQF